MFALICRRIALPALALAILASASGHVSAATALAPAALTPKAYTADQLSVLPPETQLTINGKTVTLGAMRAAHQALLARFESAGSLKSLFTFGPPQRVVPKGAVVSPERPPLTGLAPSRSGGVLMNHVPNAVPNGPIDYVAACAAHSVCVYVPPISGFSYPTATAIVNIDSLLSASVCAQDGGVMQPPSFGVPACLFSYPISAKVSAFPGNPPALQAAMAASCLGPDFATQIDPLGAAGITYNENVPSSVPRACAIDLYVPSS